MKLLIEKLSKEALDDFDVNIMSLFCYKGKFKYFKKYLMAQYGADNNNIELELNLKFQLNQIIRKQNFFQIDLNLANEVLNNAILKK